MNLILNRDFKMPDDGWYQLAPIGEFAHVGAGVVQVVDTEACVAMVSRFKADAATPNFAGLLVDFDHFSLDGERRTEAAGWIVGLEYRGRTSDQPTPDPSKEGSRVAAADSASHIEGRDGLWANIRWSDVGEQAVKGGRYRFLSPVWARTDCVDLGNGRVRPVRLLNAAVTNDPNLKGLVPLANASPVDRVPSIERVDLGHERYGVTMKRVIEKLMNHLGLQADASEDVILEKMQGLPAVTAVTELQNSLKQTQEERDALQTQLKGAEDEIVNRHLAEFEDVVTEKTKTFWREQLVANRAGALEALEDLRGKVEGKAAGKEPTPSPSKEGSRKPLHNRATTRPVMPSVNGTAENPSTGSGLAAARIRNRAQEIVKLEKVPFSVAFRRAEGEVVGNG